MARRSGPGRLTGMGKVAPGRDLVALRQRRMRAARMFDRGARQSDVAARLGVSAQMASRWHRVWREGGRAALVGTGQPGRPRRVDDAQLAQVQAALLQGPGAHGYPTDMWTLARVAEVIERVTGVRYAPTQTWTILRQ